MIHFVKYLEDLKFPHEADMIKDRVALSDWLIGSAVRFEYGDKGYLFPLVLVERSI